MISQVLGADPIKFWKFLNAEIFAQYIYIENHVRHKQTYCRNAKLDCLTTKPTVTWLYWT